MQKIRNSILYSFFESSLPYWKNTCVHEPGPICATGGEKAGYQVPATMQGFIFGSAKDEFNAALLKGNIFIQNP
jgi:hypothetical protein